MSVKAVAWVLDDLQGLKPGPSLLMLALADYADERNSCFPGQDKLAARARCSKRTVITYLHELQELGLLTVEKRFYSNGDSRIRRTSNRYVLHTDMTYGLEDAKSAHSSQRAGHTESAKSAHSSLESAKHPGSKVQPVALNEPPVINPPVPPSLQPPTQSGASNSAATPGEWPDGHSREEDSSFVESPRVAATPATRDTPPSDVITPAQDADKFIELARTTLPSDMQTMGPKDLAKVGAQIEKRVNAGWTLDQINRVLSSRVLPSKVKHLTALVMARLRDDVPTDQPPPAGVVQVGDAARQPAQSRWSHTLASGRVITRDDLDVGKLAISFNAARVQGEWNNSDRMAYAIAVGVEQFLK